MVLDPLKLLKKTRGRVHGIASWEKIRGTYTTSNHFGVFANQGDYLNFMIKSLKEDIIQVELQRSQPIEDLDNDMEFVVPRDIEESWSRMVRRLSFFRGVVQEGVVDLNKQHLPQHRLRRGHVGHPMCRLLYK